jgi:putative Ca2+/H+ antiporter (TMEM165/GDT1 family)
MYRRLSWFGTEAVFSFLVRHRPAVDLALTDLSWPACFLGPYVRRQTELANTATHLRFQFVVLLAYWTVLVAELVGDKSIYTVSALSIRFRPPIVLGTMAAAFAGKMLIVVLLGKAIMRLDSRWTDTLSAVAFLVSASLIWFDEPEQVLSLAPGETPWFRIIATCFGSLFFAEWGDGGQIAAAALTVKFGALFPVWLGGTLAMITKGMLASIIGRELREHLPQRVIRAVACLSCGVLGIIALGGVVFR